MTKEEYVTDIDSLYLMALEDSCHGNTINIIPPK